MYTITQEMIDQLKTSFTLNHIPTDKYTDDELGTILQQSVTLIGGAYVEGETITEYDPEFSGDTYITISYPILNDPEELNVTIDGNTTSDLVRSVQSNGVIHFNRPVEGQLEVTYTQALAEDVIQQYITLVALQLLGRAENGGNLSSINEGDVSISYDTTGNSTGTLDGLIAEVHGMFGARVKLL